MRLFWRLSLCLLCGAILAACGGKSAPPPTCGAQVCLTDIRVLRQESGSLTLLFELTAPDGSVDPAAPPSFGEPLHVRITTEADDHLLLERVIAPEAFACGVDNNIPGAEGHLAAACLIAVPDSDFTTVPAAGEEVAVTIYTDTFPLVLWRLTLP